MLRARERASIPCSFVVFNLGLTFESFKELGARQVWGASIEESSRALVIGELSMFKKLPILPFACVDPLAWWHIDEGQFPNVGLFAK